MPTIEPTPLRPYEKDGVIILEANLESNDGVCLICDGQPFIVIKAGLPAKKRHTVRAYLEAQVRLGFIGEWGDGLVEDRRNTPQTEQELQIGAYMDVMLHND